MVHSGSEWQVAQNVVEDALQDTIYACQSLERLPGGFINFAFRKRLVTPIEGHGETVVVKMTEDKLKVEKTTGEEFTLHKTRSYFEHQVLAHQIPSFCSKQAYDGSPFFLDLPNTSTLKAHLLNKLFEPTFADACGRVIGAWAVKFHSWGRHPDQEGLRKVLSSYTEAGVFKYRLSCGRLDATIEKFPEMLDNKKSLFQHVSQRITAITHRDDDIGIIHGDFWPGNLVFASSAKSVKKNELGADPKSDVELDNRQLIFVLDWELCHLSSIVIDLGTMLAELYIIYFFENSASVPLILQSFLEAYGSVERQDAFNTMLYCGVHLIIWPCRTEWSKSPKLMECIQYGCDILENAYKGNVDWSNWGLFQKLF